MAITVAVAARERALLRCEQHGAQAMSNGNADADVAAWRGQITAKLVMYGTTQTHSIGMKAAMVLGLNFRAIQVEKEDDFALRGNQLRKALEEDTAKGLIPFMLIATVGTTSSGAIDRLDEIEKVVVDYPDLWIHIDAAYAGVCLALPEMRKDCHLDVINRRADSFSTNMHKWGLVTFDCSPLYVRHRGDLTNALTLTPEFLRSKGGDAGSVLDLRNMQLSLGRRFRSLKVWFVLRSYGVQGFQAMLRKHIELSGVFNDLIRSSPESLPLQIVARPRWSLTVIRLEPMGLSADAVERLNRRFWDELQLRNAQLMLTQTVLPEIGFSVRFVVGSLQTQKEHVMNAFKIICEAANEALAEVADGADGAT